MKLKSLISILFFLFLFESVNAQMRERVVFHKSLDSEEMLTSFVENTSQVSEVAKAYVGIAETMLAEYAFLPTSKLKIFKSGKQKVEDAIKANLSNPELRYIRLLIQLNAPNFLGYNESIETDLKVFNTSIISYIKDAKWGRVFINNLLAGENLSEKHKHQLEKLLLKL